MTTFRTQYLSQLIGTPYRANAKGGGEFDCWSVVCDVRHQLFGDVLPEFEVPDEPSLLWLAKAFEKAKERSHWQQVVQSNGLVAAPDGSIVLMSRASQAVHCGIWLAPERRVLHAIPTDGVVFQDLMTLKTYGWSNLRYFRRADGTEA